MSDRKRVLYALELARMTDTVTDTVTLLELARMLVRRALAEPAE